jgi:hypothetical protein
VSAIDREVLDDRLELADVLQNANPLDVDDENAAADEAIRRREAAPNRTMILEKVDSAVLRFIAMVEVSFILSSLFDDR